MRACNNNTCVTPSLHLLFHGVMHYALIPCFAAWMHASFFLHFLALPSFKKKFYYTCFTGFNVCSYQNVYKYQKYILSPNMPEQSSYSAPTQRWPKFQLSVTFFPLEIRASHEYRWAARKIIYPMVPFLFHLSRVAFCPHKYSHWLVCDVNIQISNWILKCFKEIHVAREILLLLGLGRKGELNKPANWVEMP